MRIYCPDSGESVEFVECTACGGLGYHEIYINEYDLHDEICGECHGDGVVESGEGDE